MFRKIHPSKNLYSSPLHATRVSQGNYSPFHVRLKLRYFLRILFQNICPSSICRVIWKNKEGKRSYSKKYRLKRELDVSRLTCSFLRANRQEVSWIVRQNLPNEMAEKKRTKTAEDNHGAEYPKFRGGNLKWTLYHDFPWMGETREARNKSLNSVCRIFVCWLVFLPSEWERRTKSGWIARNFRKEKKGRPAWKDDRVKRIAVTRPKQTFRLDTEA